MPVFAFIRTSPHFVQLLNAEPNRQHAIELAQRVLELTKRSQQSMVKQHSPVFSQVDVHYEASLSNSLKPGPDVVFLQDALTHARRSYFSLETREGYGALHGGSAGLALESVQSLLRLYVEALTGRKLMLPPRSSTR